MTNDYLMRSVFWKLSAKSLCVFIPISCIVLVDLITAGAAISASAFSAIGSIFPLDILTFAFIAYISSSVCRDDDTHDGLANALLLCFAFGALLTLGLNIGANPLASFYGFEGETRGEFLTFARCISTALIPLALQFTLARWLIMRKNSVFGYISNLAMIPLIVFFNFLFLSHNGGVSGIAYSVTAGTAISLLICLGYFIQNGMITVSTGFKPHLPRLYSGFPLTVFLLFATLRLQAFYKLITPNALPVFMLQSTICSALFALFFALGSAVEQLTEVFLIDSDRASLRSLLQYSVSRSVLLGVGQALLHCLVSPVFVNLFKYSSEISAFGVPACIQLAAYLMPVSFFMIFYFYLSAVGKKRECAIMLCLCVFIVPVAAMLVFSRFMLSYAVWLSFMLGDISMFFFLPAMLGLKPAVSSGMLEQLLCVPEEKLPSLWLTISNSRDHVVLITRQVLDFCRRHSVDKRSASNCAVCLEDLTSNIVKYAFSDGQKHYIDIRFVLSEKKLTLRVRDNGQPFNPVEYQRALPADDPTAAPGIRLINGLSDSIDYRYCAGMNDLFIVFDREKNNQASQAQEEIK